MLERTNRVLFYFFVRQIDNQNFDILQGINLAFYQLVYQVAPNNGSDEIVVERLHVPVFQKLQRLIVEIDAGES